MGIREEIEGLRPPIKPPNAELAVIYCEALDDVRSVLDEHLTNTITLTREEVREAKADFERNCGKRDTSLPCLFAYEERCRVRLKVLGLCRLCKRLTEFAKEKP